MHTICSLTLTIVTLGENLTANKFSPQNLFNNNEYIGEAFFSGSQKKPSTNIMAAKPRIEDFTSQN